MATEFTMPKLGLTMESGTILEWLVDDGATVSEGQPLLVIETDKVESEVESSGAGVLHRTGVVGDSYACGERIGWFLAPGEALPAASAGPAASVQPAASASVPSAATAVSPPAAARRGAGGRLLASPNAKRRAASLGVDLAGVVGSGPGGRIVSEDVELAALARPAAPSLPAPASPAVPFPAGRVSGGPVLAGFAARSLADELGIDLAAVPSVTGEPRLGRADVVAYVRALIAGAIQAPAEQQTAAPAAGSTAAFPLLQEPSSVIPLRGMRGTIASRMQESLRQMAQLTLMMDVDMSAVVADRETRKAAGAAPGFTDYVIAAVARALVEHPYVNSQVTDSGIALLPRVDVGMAVAVDGGLVVPVVRDTPSHDLSALSAETTRLADAARSGTLRLPDLEGPTFSVTALGMYGVDGFTPVINAPNTAILGVGRLRDHTVWDGDTPRRTTVLTLSLTWDHRAFDGAPAAEFTRTVARLLESCDLR